MPKIQHIRQTLADGKTQILTIENGVVIKKRTVRQRKKTTMNIFDPSTKVDVL